MGFLSLNSKSLTLSSLSSLIDGNLSGDSFLERVLTCGLSLLLDDSVVSLRIIIHIIIIIILKISLYFNYYIIVIFYLIYLIKSRKIIIMNKL